METVYSHHPHHNQLPPSSSISSTGSSTLSPAESFPFALFKTYWVCRKSIVCKNQLNFPGDILFKIDSKPPIHPFNCSQTYFLKLNSNIKNQTRILTCVLNALCICITPCLSTTTCTRLGADPSEGEGLQYFAHRISVAL